MATIPTATGNKAWAQQEMAAGRDFSAYSDLGDFAGYEKQQGGLGWGTGIEKQMTWQYKKPGAPAGGAGGGGAAGPPVPGGAGSMGAVSQVGGEGGGGGGGGTGTASRVDMPGASFQAPDTSSGLNFGSVSSDGGAGYQKGSPGALNPRLGNNPRSSSMSALASMGKAY